MGKFVYIHHNIFRLGKWFKCQWYHNIVNENHYCTVILFFTFWLFKNHYMHPLVCDISISFLNIQTAVWATSLTLEGVLTQPSPMQTGSQFQDIWQSNMPWNGLHVTLMVWELGRFKVPWSRMDLQMRAGCNRQSPAKLSNTSQWSAWLYNCRDYVSFRNFSVRQHLPSYICYTWKCHQVLIT